MEYHITDNNGILHKIQRNDDESSEEFYFRCDYISSVCPRNKDEYNKVLDDSIIEKNINFIKVKYKS